MKLITPYMSPRAFETELNRIVPPAEAARLRGCSKYTLRRLEARGELKRVQISARRIGYRVRDVLMLGEGARS